MAGKVECSAVLGIALLGLGMSVSIAAAQEQISAPEAGLSAGAVADTGGQLARAGEVWVEPEIGIRFRFIPAGSFEMGSPEGETGRGKDEVRHQVSLTRDFWIGETEVTQAQWRAVTGENPSFFPNCGDDCPVESIAWSEAVVFANALSARAGLEPCYDIDDDEVGFLGLDCEGFRLPTEAEWEWAARSGTDAALYTGPQTIVGLANSPELDPIAWYGGNSGVDYEGGYTCSDWRETQQQAERCGPHPVGRKLPNQWHLYDIVGGVWEWVNDRYGAYPTEAVVDPLGPSESVGRVARGCGWDSAAKVCRVANRSTNAERTRYRFTGLRIARTATPGVHADDAEPASDPH